MGRSRKTTAKEPLGFEQKLWAAADKMRGHMDPAEYKHVALGLIFLKYISDAFEEKHAALVAEHEEEAARSLAAGGPGESGIDPEDRDEYLAENVFWVPREARWSHLQANARQPEIGKLIDDAMVAIERENPQLKGVLSKNYARPDIDKTQLGELIDLIGTIAMGDAESRSKDLLGRVYEYFLGRFASAEGKGGGEFYTARCVVKLLVEMLEPFRGRVYDPCCGSGGMFVQSERFVEEHGGRRGDIAIYGQESNPTTWRLAAMNMAIRGIDFNSDRAIDELQTLKLAAFLRTNLLITVHRAGLRSVKVVRNRIEESGRVPQGGVVQLLWSICDEMIDLYFPIVDEIGVADAHPLGAKPFEREQYAAKFTELAAGVIDDDEQRRFLSAAQNLPALQAGGLGALNPLVNPAVLDTAPAIPPGIFDFDTNNSAPQGVTS